MQNDLLLKKICGVVFMLLGFFGFWGMLIMNSGHYASPASDFYLTIGISIALFFSGCFILATGNKRKRG